MDNTSTLETLESFSNGLATQCVHKVGAFAILYPLVKIKQFQELLMVVNKAPGSL